jgi:hypothetical protein
MRIVRRPLPRTYLAPPDAERCDVPVAPAKAAWHASKAAIPSVGVMNALVAGLISWMLRNSRRASFPSPQLSPEGISMAAFLLLYRADPAAMAALPQPTPEEGAQIMKAWMDWGQSAGDAIIDFGNPTVAASPGADPTVGGYSLVAADSYEEVSRLLSGHPHSAMGGTIDVYEVQPIGA